MIKDETKAVIGVDVGLSGGTVLLRLDREIMDVCFNYPGTVKYAELIADWMDDFKIVDVLIENQHAWPQQGVCSTFTLGQNFGELIGVFSAFKLPISFIDARTWQKSMLQGTNALLDTKERAAEAAKWLFPEVSLIRTQRCKVQHDGAVDALLIAEYSRKSYLATKFENEDAWIQELPDKKEDFEFKSPLDPITK